ncbi:putative ABC transport system permease protein [Thermoanaerobacter thermohydrosulfuricus]|nr:putative ABC transport system permease protein [Thermoanaerobacter thermohydrosulfuricus]
MLIKKIPLRVMQREFLQFFSIIMLVAIASMTYTLFAVSMEDIDVNYKMFIKDYVQEDGYFITSQNIDEKLLKEKFGVELEERLFYEVQENGITLRIFSISDRINKPYIEAGKKPQDGEVLLDPSFFKAHQYHTNDSITILNKKFTVSGIGYLPDYIYIIKNDQDILPDPKHFGVVLMTENDMKKLFPALPVHYYSYKGRLNNIEDFKSFINSNWHLLKFVEKSENPRIIYTEMKLENAKRMTLPLSLFIILVSSFILFIVMRRIINTMHAEIGTLYSMGYTQKDVFRVFMRFPLYIWLTGSILGILLGYFEAYPLSEFYRSYFTLPKLKNVLPWQHIFVALALPAVFIFISGYLALKNFFKLTIVQMLHGVDEIKFGKLPGIKFFDRFEFQTKIMLKYGYRHFPRELVLAVGIIFSTILMMYGMTAKDSIVVAIERTYEKNFKYEYLYLLNSVSTHPEIKLTNQAEPYNVMSFDIEGRKLSIMIYGIKKDSQMIKLYDNKGNEIPISNKLVISRPLANKLGLKEGDKIHIKSKFTDKKYTLKVYKIADLPVGNSGYMDLESFNKIFGYSREEYIGIFSKEKLSLSNNLIFESYSKSELVNTIKASACDLSKTIEVMALVAAILALLIVYVLSTLTVNENKKNIGILKMLGYREGSIFKMMLGFNNFSFLAGFIIGVPLSKITMDSLMNAATKDIDFAMMLDVSTKSIFSTFAVLFFVFVVSRFLVRKKMAKVMPVEILREQVD